jgi:hypothetical protein
VTLLRGDMTAVVASGCPVSGIAARSTTPGQGVPADRNEIIVDLSTDGDAVLIDLTPHELARIDITLGGQ